MKTETSRLIFGQPTKESLFSLKEEGKKIKIILGITCSIFLLINIFSIFIYGNSTLLGSLTNPDNDDVKFIRSAWTLVDTGQYVYHNPGISTAFMMPGLPYSLAFFVILFGKFDGITAYRIFQSIIQTGSLYLVFLIGRKIFNSKIGIMAVIINALYISDYWVANLILTESLFKFFVLLLIYFSIYAIEKKNTKYYIFGGISWALATYFRPTIAAFPIIILIIWILRKYSIKEMFKYGTIVLGIFCLIMSPWWIRNYNVFHKFVPLTLATGNPMLQGTYINYDQSTKATDGLNYNQFKYTGKEYQENQVDIQVSKYRLKNLVPKHPLKFLLWYTLGKTYYEIRMPFLWIPFLGVPFVMSFLWHYLIIVFGVIGIVKFYLNKNRNRMGIIALLMILYFIVIYLPFYAFERYFYPAMPYLIIFAAYAFLNIKEKKFKTL
ncbi:MAG: glycosyltransferase family 39 protein [Clostridium sp.]|uniref:ArnT family glycosyltransferase n=1 Tax=Clostridium sp. TaxID=1506 RepID=UPI0039E81B47